MYDQTGAEKELGEEDLSICFVRMLHRNSSLYPPLDILYLNITVNLNFLLISI